MIGSILLLGSLLLGQAQPEQAADPGSPPAARLLPHPVQISSGESAFAPLPFLNNGESRPLFEYQVDERIVDGDKHMAIVETLLQGRPIFWDSSLTTEEGDVLPGEVQVKYDERLGEEEYRLLVGKSIHIYAATLRGLARATATLMQLWPLHGGEIPAMEIHDYPANTYRNFMVDIGRNPISLGTLKETIDLLWYYKLDSLHIHLTDDQRFAFPSKKFPKLVTEKGKITWEEFAELDEYARLRGIHLIPELEVPGHSSILRNKYPEVFGKTPTDLAKNPEARIGIKALLDEIIEVFPSSPYIHVGGDEAYGVPHEYQRDLINDLNRHLKKRGKTTVVWEGPALGEGDNKVDEDVIHINWRTIEFPAQQMLDAGYKVVNAAWDPLYLVDHYPRNNFTMASPAHIYMQMDLQRFAHFNPGIPTFGKPHRTNTTENIIGYCMPWWEGREQNYLPMVVPHLIPMAAVAWAEPPIRRLDLLEKQTRATETQRKLLFYPIRIHADNLAVESAGVFHHQTQVQLSTRFASGRKDAKIHYTLDGSEPTPKSAVYEKPFALKQSAIVRAKAFGEPFHGSLTHGSRRTLIAVDPVDNLALGKPVTTSVPAGPVYCAERLTDGGTGNLDYFLGYPATPRSIEINIDLGTVQNVGSVVVHTYRHGESYESYEVMLSADGKEWTPVADRRQKPEGVSTPTTHDFATMEARFVRVFTSGHKGQVFDSFSRITEIQVFPPNPVDQAMADFMNKHQVPGASVAIAKDG